MRTLTAFLAALACVASAATATSAEEVRMTLSDCLREALGSSTEIREGRHAPPIAETWIAEARSEFEHLLTFSASGGRSRSPVGTQLGGADVLEQQTFSGAVAVEQRLRTGGAWSFGFRSDDLLTNSRFFTVRPQWTNALTFSVSQPVLRGAGFAVNEARERIAEADYRGAQAAYLDVLNRTLAAVERAYWSLVGLRADLDVKRRSLEVAEELLRISRRRLEAGAGIRVEVVQAEAGVARREKELIAAEQLVQNAEDALRAFVFPFSDDPERDVSIVPVDPVDPPPPAVGADVPARLSTAFLCRPDVLAARETLEAAGIRVVQSESELLPRLDLVGTVGLSGLKDDFFDSTSKVLSGDFPAWEVGLALEIPLGNLGARARHRRSLLERSRAAAQFESLENRVVVEIRAAVRGIETARREIEATRRAVAAAEAQFEAEQDRVRAEKSTNYQLLEVEEDLAAARSQAILALVTYRNALVDLEEATGTFLARRELAPPPAAEDGE